jgi:hypothetical protein
MSIGQALAGGITSVWGESWFFWAVLLPFVLTSSVLGHLLYKKKWSNKTNWLVSLVSALFVSLFSGTVGAIGGEFIVRGGFETINVRDTLIWGTIYSFMFLPVSVPFMRVNMALLSYVVKKK